MLRTGTEAPDFTAALDSGGALTLSDLRGQNVVLYFYPRAFTHGCTAQAKGFCAALPAITAADAIVVGISTDDADTLYRFRNAFDLLFDLVTDASGEDPQAVRREASFRAWHVPRDLCHRQAGRHTRRFSQRGFHVQPHQQRSRSMRSRLSASPVVSSLLCIP